VRFIGSEAAHGSGSRSMRLCGRRYMTLRTDQYVFARLAAAKHQVYAEVETQRSLEIVLLSRGTWYLRKARQCIGLR
jgi:hypothetical protein